MKKYQETWEKELRTTEDHNMVVAICEAIKYDDGGTDSLTQTLANIVCLLTKSNNEYLKALEVINRELKAVVMQERHSTKLYT